MTGLEPVDGGRRRSTPMSPYGRSQADDRVDARATSRRRIRSTYGVLRYFNVAGADPKKRSGQSTPTATHLIKVAAQTALGQRPKMDIFGTDYPTPDGTCVRDYIHVTDLVEAHALLLDHLRGGGESTDAQLRLWAGLFGARR